MKQHYDLLILGATALGTGIIEAHPELSIALLERTSSVAGEFANAYKGGSANSAGHHTPEAFTLWDECLARRALDEKGEWFPAISPVLANRMRNSTADCYFFAVLKNIEPAEQGHSVPFSAFGMDHSFTASKIIDTTAQFISRTFFGEAAPEMREITFNYFDADKNVLSLPCEDDIAASRTQLYRQEDHIFKEAWELSCTPSETHRDMGAAAWVPSTAREDFLTAYNDGAAAILPEGVPSAVRPETVNSGEYDLIVVGLGVAGTIAAVTAKEEGLRVLGIENLSAGGGYPEPCTYLLLRLSGRRLPQAGHTCKRAQQPFWLRTELGHRCRRENHRNRCVFIWVRYSLWRRLYRCAPHREQDHRRSLDGKRHTA